MNRVTQKGEANLAEDLEGPGVVDRIEGLGGVEKEEATLRPGEEKLVNIGSVIPQRKPF